MNEENISINFDDIETGNIETNVNDDKYELESILKEINDYSGDCDFNTETFLTIKAIDYDTNYNIKQLLLICDYYGLSKEVKLNKFKKSELILFLLDFEENIDNSLVVYKRKQLWYFIEELKNDKFMKKYILW
jgi:hypothetical protein